MIKIRVVSYKEQLPPKEISAEFDEKGGFIGREINGNTLLLEDPHRNISRKHASISFRKGEFFLCNLGSTLPTYLSGRSLSNGDDAVISDSDRIHIGDYVMQVVENKNLLNSVDGKLSDEAMQHSLAQSAYHADNQSLADLLADSLQNRFVSKEKAPNLESVSELDPFSISATPTPKQLIPIDFDPFAELSSASNKLPEMAPSNSKGFANELDSALESKERHPSINTVIGSRNSLLDSAALIDTSSVNPLVALGNLSKSDEEGISSVQSNDTSDLQDSVPSLDVKIESSISAVPVEQFSSDREALLHAFLVGAGIPNLDKSVELTPQLMNLIGQLLRESTQGTIDLLLARALIRSEIRALRTVIAPRENNPLKLSPNVEVALTHLLAPKGKEHGFMTPLQAIKDAHNDLRSHQFGFMAGMRAAVSGILDRFNPDRLEKRLSQRTIIDSVFSLNRRAKLWDLFTERYNDISHEAEEDFHVVFGKEFLRAYEAQIAKLEKDDNKR